MRECPAVFPAERKPCPVPDPRFVPGGAPAAKVWPASALAREFLCELPADPSGDRSFRSDLRSGCMSPASRFPEMR
jgi:hypothetical protein